MSLTCFGQDSLSIDTRQTNGVDSIHASHTTFSSNTLEDATKAEGDSAYIKEDYAAAIQIYEALLKNGEAADVYYNLGNSYYKIGEIAKAVLNMSVLCYYNQEMVTSVLILKWHVQKQ
jgi:Tetratricopeptide repeat.